MSNYDPNRHEQLAQGCEWSEAAARETIAAIVDEAVHEFDAERGFPAHPREDNLAMGSGFYLGSGGVLWALWYLHRGGYAKVDENWLIGSLGPLSERCGPEVKKIARTMANEVAYLFSRLPLAMMLVELTKEDRWREPVIEDIVRSVDAPVREFMWGTPGVLTATHLVQDQTVRDEVRDADARNVEKMLAAWSAREHGLSVFKEELYGGSKVMNGLVHGMAGQVLPLLQRVPALEGDAAERVNRDTVDWLLRSATRGEHGANWAPDLIPAGTDTTPFVSHMMLQICHGAPGVIVGCRGLAGGQDSETEVNAVLAEGAELTWHAGPLQKGPGLCHGTAGNGYAFLVLYERTGDPQWLERARLFAAHAIDQFNADVAEFGQQRFTLWTGDPGLAVYLAGCIDGDARFPTLDVF